MTIFAIVRNVIKLDIFFDFSCYLFTIGFVLASFVPLLFGSFLVFIWSILTIIWYILTRFRSAIVFAIFHFWNKLFFLFSFSNKKAVFFQKVTQKVTQIFHITKMVRTQIASGFLRCCKPFYRKGLKK